MADTLRELVVSLSLQSDNFSKNIQTVQRQIKEAESRFEAAGAGVDKFAKSTDGLKAKASMLSEKLRGQNQIVEQYARALQQANATLQRNAQTQQQTSAKLATAKKSQADLNKEVERAKTVLASAEKAYGKNGAVANNAREALADLEEQYAAASEEVKKLEGQLESNSKAMERNADQITTIETSLNKAKAAEAATKAELDKTNAALKHHKAQWEAAAASLDKFGKRATTAGQNLSRVGQSLTTYVSAPLLALGGYAIKASIDAESAFAGVRKTVDMTEEEFARLDDTLTAMSTSKPATYTDIAGLAETGGQLGIANENLETFVSTMTDLGVATNLVGQEGAAQMAKFANVTGMSQENFDRMGAAIVDLGNNMATTEADIMSMAMRLGAAGSQVGLTESQILGFSAALSSVGIEAEAGGSAFSKAMIGMELAVVTGKNGLKDYAKVAGMSSKEFQKAWKDDAAGAMQAFIVGLSKMDEEGISTIKVLDDMGFSEVRLRDTLMRATNASGLFSQALSVSSGAWKSNTALTNEASKRYATTESRLTMLKNKSTALARTFGDDLSPAFGDLIDQAGEWLEGLTKMDAGQRQTMLTTAAWIAAIGPGIMLIGKLNTAVGAMATGFSSLIQTSVAAGGGLKGLLAATGSLLGPAGIAVLAGAALYGAAQWYDYASGAKAAREALEGIEATAKKWKETQAVTIFDTGNDPLARFGLSKESFSGGQEQLEGWLSRLTATWTDGKKESNEIVKGYVDEFTSGTDKIREAIKERQKTQEKYGVTGDQTTEDDLKKLKAYDKEVEALLKKRKNGKLTEDDQTRLNQIIQERVDLQLKYTTGEGGGYSSLIEAVEAEKARLAAEGKDPGADLYGDTLTGAAQGYQTQVDALNQSYRDQYADIMAITDEKEREAALTLLNTEHTLALKKAQEDYQKVLGKYSPEAFQLPEMQTAQDDLQKITDLITTINADGKATPEELESLKTLTDGLDEGKLASLKAMLDQLKAGGLGDLTIGGTEEDPIKASDLLGGYDTVAAFLEANKGTWTDGLAGMFGAVDEEAARVNVAGVVSSYIENPEGIDISALKPSGIVALVSTYGEVTGGANTDALSPDDVEALVKAYDEIAAGADVSELKPEQIKAIVDRYGEATGVDTSSLSPSGLMALVSAYKEIEAGAATGSLKPEDIVAYVVAYQEAATGASTSGLSPDNILALVSAYNEIAAGADVSDLKPEQIKAIVDKYGEATGADTSALTPENIKAIVSAYQEIEGGASTEKLTPVVRPTVSVDFSALDQKALDAYYAANPGSKPAVVTEVGLQFGWAGRLDTAVEGGLATIWKDGKKLPLTPDIIGSVSATDIWAEGFDENGKPKLDIIIVPKLGTPEAVNDAQGELDKKPDSPLPEWMTNSTTGEKVENLANNVAFLNQVLEDGDTQTAQLTAEPAILKSLSDLDPTDLQNIGTYIAQAMAALSSGTLTPEQTAQVQTQLDAMLSVVKAADQYLGVGNDISAGIAKGMNSYGWTGDATTLAGSIESAIRSALNSNSPAIKMVPVGVDIAAGVAKGIEDGTYKVENAMVAMARKALAKAKEELVINSPSHLFRDKVGRSIPEGTAQGVLLETEKQKGVIANAFRSLVQPALSGANGAMYDNRRTINNRSDLNLVNPIFQMGNNMDAQALLYELLGLMRGQQRALGGTP